MTTPQDFSDTSEIGVVPEAQRFPHYIPPPAITDTPQPSASHVDYRGTEQHGVAFDHIQNATVREDSVQAAIVNSVDQRNPYDAPPFDPIPVVVVETPSLSKALIKARTLKYTLPIGAAGIQILGQDRNRNKAIVTVKMGNVADAASASPVLNVMVNTTGVPTVDTIATQGFLLNSGSTLEVETNDPLYATNFSTINDAVVTVYVEYDASTGGKVV